jgi:hypothetical protein
MKTKGLEVWLKCQSAYLLNKDLVLDLLHSTWKEGRKEGGRERGKEMD